MYMYVYIYIYIYIQNVDVYVDMKNDSANWEPLDKVQVHAETKHSLSYHSVSIGWFFKRQGNKCNDNIFEHQILAIRQSSRAYVSSHSSMS